MNGIYQIHKIIPRLLVIGILTMSMVFTGYANNLNEEDLADQVIIKRTEYGVPHIEADNLKAAGYALGYAQMEDYAEKVIKQLLHARGEYTKYYEVPSNRLEGAIDRDVSRKIKHQKATRTWTQLNTDTREMVTGFTAGVNKYIELHSDEFEDWVKPFFTVYDVQSAEIEDIPFYSAREFLTNLRKEERKKDNRTSFRSPDEEDADNLWTRLAFSQEVPHQDLGSNAWALAPNRTKSGKAILLRNPHLNWDAGYYEVHMKVLGKFDFYGDFRIGAPLITIGGFNQHLGFSTTNNSSFMDEIYALEVDPDRPDHYILDGKSHAVQKQQFLVEVKNGDGISTTTKETLSTPYGPVIHRGNGKIYILKSGAEHEFRGGQQFLEMMKAKNLNQWKDAMRMRGIITSNFTYADRDGNIFYVWNGSVPDLPVKWSENKKATEVSKSEDIWENLVDWDKLPQLENPKGGYLHNENDTFHFTNLNEVLAPEDFPAYFPKPTFRLRSQSSHEMISNPTQKFSLEDVVDYQNRSKMILADRVKPDLLKAIQDSDPSDKLASVGNFLKDWDNTVDVDSKGGVLFKTWWYRYVSTAPTKESSSRASAGFSAKAEELFEEPWSEDKPETTPYGLSDSERAVEALAWAIDKTEEDYGSWKVSWGEVHRAQAKGKDIGANGCSGLLGCFRVLWFTDATKKDHKQLKVTGGDGWTFAVEFEKTPRAYSILAYGQSEKEDSPYYYDQLELFMNKEMKKVAYTPREIKKQQLKEYRPGKEKK